MDLTGGLSSARNLVKGGDEGDAVGTRVVLGMDGEVGPEMSPLEGDAVKVLVEADKGDDGTDDDDDDEDGTLDDDGDFFPNMPERKLDEDLVEILVLSSTMESLVWLG